MRFRSHFLLMLVIVMLMAVASCAPKPPVEVTDLNRVLEQAIDACAAEYAAASLRAAQEEVDGVNALSDAGKYRKARKEAMPLVPKIDDLLAEIERSRDEAESQAEAAIASAESAIEDARESEAPSLAAASFEQAESKLNEARRLFGDPCRYRGVAALAIGATALAETAAEEAIAQRERLDDEARRLAEEEARRREEEERRRLEQLKLARMEEQRKKSVAVQQQAEEAIEEARKADAETYAGATLITAMAKLEEARLLLDDPDSMADAIKLFGEAKTTALIAMNEATAEQAAQQGGEETPPPVLEDVTWEGEANLIAPKEMFVAEEQEVELVIERGAGSQAPEEEEDFEDQDVEDLAVESRTVRVGLTMLAELKSRPPGKFIIDPPDPVEQTAFGGEANWQWHVTPLEEGKYHLQARLTIIEDMHGNEISKDVEIPQQPITVKITVKGRIARLLAGPGKYILGVLIVPMILLLFKYWLDKRKAAAAGEG